MPQSKFKVGDIVEHIDGSLYIINGDTGDRYTCVTIFEANENLRLSGAQYACAYVFIKKLTKISHIDEAV